MKLYFVGKHRVLLGDSTNPDHVESLFLGKKADMLFTSPPYLQARDYYKKIEDWDRLMYRVFKNIRLVPDGQIFVNLGLIHRKGEWFPYWDNWINSMREMGWKRFAINIWHKTNPIPTPGMGRLTLSFEFIFQFNKQNQKLRQPNYIDPCKNAGLKIGGGVKQKSKSGKTIKWSQDRNKGVQSHKPFKNVLITPVSNPYSHNGEKHPATFPVQLSKIFIESFTQPNQIIFDPFLGSGSTIVAAHQTGRIGYGIELAEPYIQMTLARLEKETGITPVQVI